MTWASQVRTKWSRTSIITFRQPGRQNWTVVDPGPILRALHFIQKHMARTNSSFLSKRLLMCARSGCDVDLLPWTTEGPLQSNRSLSLSLSMQCQELTDDNCSPDWAMPSQCLRLSWNNKKTKNPVFLCFLVSFMFSSKYSKFEPRTRYRIKYSPFGALLHESLRTVQWTDGCMTSRTSLRNQLVFHLDLWGTEFCFLWNRSCTSKAKIWNDEFLQRDLFITIRHNRVRGQQYIKMPVGVRAPRNLVVHTHTDGDPHNIPQNYPAASALLTPSIPNAKNSTLSRHPHTHGYPHSS